MNDLILIQEHEGKPTVNARELHAFLEVGKDFSTWVKDRIEKYGFSENTDFVKISRPPVSGSGNRGASVEYFLSLDMGKEISMVENNEKGKQARLYFIEVEKLKNRAPSGGELIALALIEAKNLLDAKDKQIKDLKPRAELADALMGSKTAIDVGEVAKALNLKYHNKVIGRNELFDILRKFKILNGENIPFQSFIDRGYFRVVESLYHKPDGSKHVSLKTVVFQTGVNYIRKILLKEVGAVENGAS